MRLIDADALKEALYEEYEAREHYIGEIMLKAIDNAPTVTVNCKDCDGYEAGYSAGLKDVEGFTRKELESWLYAIAINNTNNELGSYCEEIIKRLDGFERYVLDMRKGVIE